MTPPHRTSTRATKGIPPQRFKSASNSGMDQTQPPQPTLSQPQPSQPTPPPPQPSQPTQLQFPPMQPAPPQLPPSQPAQLQPPLQPAQSENPLLPPAQLQFQQSQLLSALAAQIQALKESVDQLRNDTSENQNETERLRRAIDFQDTHNMRLIETNPAVETTSSTRTTPLLPVAQPHKKLYDLPIFSGRPDDWPLFFANYQETTANFAYTPMENTIRLQKCLQGEAKEAVAALLIHPNNIDQVMSTLAFRFGRADLLVRAQLAKVQQFPTVSENKIESIIAFSSMVDNVVAFLVAAKCEHHLANPMLLEELVMKLPASRKYEWAKRALEVKPYPTIENFSAWLSGEAQIIQMLPQASTSNIVRGQVPHPRRMMHTTEKTYVSKEMTPKTCTCCGSNHQLPECSVFRNLSVEEKWKLVKNKRLCFSCIKGGHGTALCRAKKRCQINGCGKFHHKLLHENTTERQGSGSEPTPAQSSERVHTCQAQDMDGQLFRILPITVTGPKGYVNTYAMFDEGSSISIVEETVANQLGLKGQAQPLTLQWYGTKVVTEASRKVSFEIRGIGETHSSFYIKDIRTVKDLSLPRQSFSKEHFDYLKGVPIQNMKNAKPTILIGLDNCYLGVAEEVIEGKFNEPIAVHTRLGWLAYGPRRAEPNIKSIVLYVRETEELDKLNKMVESYFTTENFGVQKPEAALESVDDVRARKILEETTRRTGNEFESGLLWRSDKLKIPESYQMALKRLYSLESKMKKDVEFSTKYKKQMAHYIEMKYARELLPWELKKKHSRVWYLPHFGIVNPHKPEKLRIVFDAAAESNGVSLNNMLLKGPKQAKPLLTILFKFRQGVIGVVGDIKEMFSQIKIRKEDQSAQRFLWRSEQSQPIRTYVMSSMIFGAVCSPCTAEYIKNINANRFKESSSEAVHIIVNHHYVDDMVYSFSDPAEAKVICQEVKRIHAEGGFTLRNFVSNNKAIQTELNNQLNSSQSTVELEPNDAGQKVLGMYWKTEDDTFRFRLRFHNIKAEILELAKAPTKREMLGIIMAVFDPYGFLANFLLYSKILLQQTWNTGMDWDDPFPNDLFHNWKLWWSELKKVGDLQMPRCYSPKLPYADDIQLHIFTDASESAFSAVGYLRIQHQNQIHIAFVSGKTKCAPKKILSIPRLELQAAVLGSRLSTTIQANHDIAISKVVYWSDSKTTIWWIKSSQRRYKPFVAHRIAEILENSTPENWHWLPTDMNVADDATRATKPPKFVVDSRWLIGPKFLCLSEGQWPQSSDHHAPETLQEEIKPRILCVRMASNLIETTRFSSYNRLRRAVAYVLRSKRWLNRAKQTVAAKRLRVSASAVESHHQISNKNVQVSTLTAEEVTEAEKVLFKIAQKDVLFDEIQCLRKGLPIPKNSQIFQLTPYLDEKGLLRLNGRINAASCLSEEDEPLTPNHFLIGCTNSTQTPNLTESPVCGRKQWKIAQQLKDRFWKRWILEYLPYLTKRSKWHEKSKPLMVGDLVIICDATQPRSKWQRGKIVKVFTAKDEQVRSAEVRTINGILRRPTSKLAVLEVMGESQEHSRRVGC